MHQTSWSPVWVNKSPGQAYKTYCFTHILASLLGKFYNILCIFVVELVELKFQQLFFMIKMVKLAICQILIIFCWHPCSGHLRQN